MSKNDRPTLPEGLASPDDATSQETRPPPPTAVPWLMLSQEQVLTLGLDHREGFLLSLIDGKTNVETLLALASLPEKQVLRLLARWAAMGIIELKQLPAARARARPSRR